MVVAAGMDLDFDRVIAGRRVRYVEVAGTERERQH